jgi:hypothetical protein
MKHKLTSLQPIIGLSPDLEPQQSVYGVSARAHEHTIKPCMQLQWCCKGSALYQSGALWRSSTQEEVYWSFIHSIVEQLNTTH